MNMPNIRCYDPPRIFLARHGRGKSRDTSQCWRKTRAWPSMFTYAEPITIIDSLGLAASKFVSYTQWTSLKYG